MIQPQQNDAVRVRLTTLALELLTGLHHNADVRLIREQSWNLYILSNELPYVSAIDSRKSYSKPYQSTVVFSKATIDEYLAVRANKI